MKRLITLKEELFRRNISSLKISQDLKINPSLFSMFLNGWRKMPDSLKKEVAEYLNLEPEKLFDDYTESER